MAARRPGINTLNGYLERTLLMGQNLVQALNDQGLNDFNDLIGLTEDDIDAICTNVKKPGGTIPNPNAGVANQPAVIPNPGVQFGQIYEKRLRELRYYIFHLSRVQRLPIVAQDSTLARLTKIYQLKDLDEPSDDPTLPEPLLKIESARKCIEDLDDYLINKRGGSGLPLAYVVRLEVQLPAVDLGFGLPTHLDEMIERGPHTGQYYEADNRAVWQVIRHVTHGGMAWNWVSRFARQHNGRAAYLALKTHYLGDSYQRRIRAAADNTLEKAYFDGTVRTFTFEHYTGALNNAFADIEISGEQVSEIRKVRILLNGIRDARLNAARNQVLATPKLEETFEAAANYIAQFADKVASTAKPKVIADVATTSTSASTRSKQSNNSNRKRSNQTQGGPGRGDNRSHYSGRGGSRTGRSSTHFPGHVWRTFTEEQKAIFQAGRSATGRGPPGQVRFEERSQISGISTTNTTPTTAQSNMDTQTNQGNQSSHSVGMMMSRRQTNYNNNGNA